MLFTFQINNKPLIWVFVQFTNDAKVYCGSHLDSTAPWLCLNRITALFFWLIINYNRTFLLIFISILLEKIIMTYRTCRCIMYSIIWRSIFFNVIYMGYALIIIVYCIMFLNSIWFCLGVNYLDLNSLFVYHFVVHYVLLFQVN